MADGDEFADLAAEVVGEMDDDVVLDVGLGADDDFIDISTEGGVVPDAGFLMDCDTPDDVSTACDEGGGGNFWTEIFVGFDGHDRESENLNQKSTIVIQQSSIQSCVERFRHSVRLTTFHSVEADGTLSSS